MRKLASSVILSLSLIGCSGGSVGVSNENSEVSGNESNSIIRKIKEITGSKASTYTIEMPASVLIVESAKDWMEANNVLDISMSWSMEDDSCQYQDIIHKKMGIELQTANSMESILKREAKEKKIDGLDKLDASRLCASIYLRDSAFPFSGWYSDIEPIEQIRRTFLAGYIANGLETQVMARLNSNVWKSDVIAKNAISKALDEIVADGTYHDIAIEGLRIAYSSHTVRDLAGKHPASVHFSMGEYDVAADGYGIVLLKSGVPWFGQGFITSKKYLIGVSSVDVASMKKSKEVTDKKNNSNAEKSADQVGVSN